MQTPVKMDERLANVKNVFEKPGWYLNGRSYHVSVRAKLVGELHGDMKFQRILDIGCGDGSISLPLLTPDRKLTFLDMSDTMLSIARSRVPNELAGNVETLSGDFMNTDFGDRAYDLIICLGVLSYIDAPRPFIDKLYSLLQPGGTIIIEWANGDHFMNRVARAWDRATNAKFRLAIHTSEKITGLLNSAGFQKLGSYQYFTPMRVMRKIFTQRFNFRLISAVHGAAKKNRAPWLGDECIFWYRKADSQNGRAGDSAKKSSVAA
jgi:2-polyprenyl-3-methyl-5-hydroxy-6-metoxy-1,4-benzoquinol methylase